MLKIFGVKISDNCLTVQYTAEALKLEYEYTELNLEKGEHQTDEYKEGCPTGKVPSIDDDGFKLFESASIAQYLCEKNDSDLYPKDLKQKAIVNAWIDYSTLHVGAAKNRVTFNRILAPQFGLPVDESSLKTGLEFLEKYYPVLDKQLGKHKFIAGDTMTLADIVLLAQFTHTKAADIEPTEHKNLMAWLENMRNQDFAKVNQ